MRCLVYDAYKQEKDLVILMGQGRQSRMNNAVKLGVNVDHVATLRQNRGTAYPCPVQAALLCEQVGAHGITVHLREDRRHIQDEDVRVLRRTLGIPLNLEMAQAADIVDLAVELAPPEVCIVPERRQELTTEGGLDAAGQLDTLGEMIMRLKDVGSLVSLFIAPEAKQIEAAVTLGAPVIELHTGTFCDATGTAADDELARLIEAAKLAHQADLQVNAGHGIHLGNLQRILEIPHLDTLNIGHSIVSRSVFVGLEQAVRELLKRL